MPHRSLEVREASLLWADGRSQELPAYSDRDAVFQIMAGYLALSWLAFACLVVVEYVAEGSLGFDTVSFEIFEGRIRRWWISALVLAALAFMVEKLISCAPAVFEDIGDTSSTSESPVDEQVRNEAPAMELGIHDNVAARRLLRTVGEAFIPNSFKLKMWIKFSGCRFVLSIFSHFVCLEFVRLLASPILSEIIKWPFLLEGVGLSSYLISLSFTATKFISAWVIKNDLFNIDFNNVMIDSFANKASYGSLMNHLLTSSLFSVTLPYSIFIQKALASREDTLKFDALVHASFMSYLTTILFGQAKMWAMYVKRRLCPSQHGEPKNLKKAVAGVRKKIAKSYPDLASDPVIEDFVRLHLGALEKQSLCTEAMSGGFDLGKEIDILVFAVVYPISMSVFNPTILLMAAALLPVVTVLTWIRWRIAVTQAEELRAYVHNFFRTPERNSSENATIEGLQGEQNQDELSAHGLDNDIRLVEEQSPEMSDRRVEKLSPDLLQMSAIPAVIFYCASTIAGLGASFEVFWGIKDEVMCTTTKWKNLCISFPMIQEVLVMVMPAMLAFYLLEAACLRDRSFRRSELSRGSALPQIGLFRRALAADRFDRSMYAILCSSAIPMAAASSLTLDRCAAGMLPTEWHVCRCALRSIAACAVFAFMLVFQLCYWFCGACVRDLWMMWRAEQPDGWTLIVLLDITYITCAFFLCCIFLLVGFLMAICCGKRIRSAQPNALPERSPICPEYEVAVVTNTYEALRAAHGHCDVECRRIINDISQRFPSSASSALGFNSAWRAANLRFKLALLQNVEKTNHAIALKHLAGGQEDYLVQFLLSRPQKLDSNHAIKAALWKKVWVEGCALAAQSVQTAPLGTGAL